VSSADGMSNQLLVRCWDLLCTNDL